MTIKIVSAAKHSMLTKAADDPAYARQRGIDPDLAKQSLLEHAKGGAPKLPDRVEPKSVAPRAAKTTMPVFLESRRG
jgi:hypothetical protein